MSLDTKCYGAFKWTQVGSRAWHAMTSWDQESVFEHSKKTFILLLELKKMLMYKYAYIYLYCIYTYIYIYIFFICQYYRLCHQFLEFTDSMRKPSSRSLEGREPFMWPKRSCWLDPLLGWSCAFGIRWVKRVVL